MTLHAFRGALAACAALSALACAAAKAEPITNVVARPAAAPFETTVAGRPASDPYRWMEAPDRAAEVRAWLQSASDHTTAELARMPGFEPLVARLRDAGAGTVVDSNLQVRGGLTFRLSQAPGDALPRLVVRAADGKDRTLYDPSAPGATGAINNYAVAPDGRRVAVHTAAKGAEVGMIRVIDVASGAVDPIAAGPVWGEFPARWIDASAFLYVQAPEDNPIGGGRLRLRRLGATGDDPVLVTNGGPEGLGPQELFSIDPTVDSGWAMILTDDARADRRLLVAPTALLGRPGTWREIAGYERQVTHARLFGDALYAISTLRASNGEVARIDLRTGREVVLLKAGELVLQDLLPTSAGLYVVGLKDGFEQLMFLPLGASQPVPVDLPAGGRISELRRTGDGRTATLAYSGWLTNRAYYRVTGVHARPIPYGAATAPDLAGFEVLHEQATSQDGTRVPLTILAPRGLPRDGSAVTILDGYGGYGVPVTPFYRTEFHVWLARGGVFAFCGVRGGGDKGRAWHQAGRGPNKPKGQQDFIACGERLTQLGFTSPGKLVAHGASNGGLVVGPAVLQKPDLFAAALLRRAMLNATRIGASRNGPNHFAEMGDPAQPTELAGLYEQDAYLWLDRAADAPHLLLSLGLNDNRVEPWASAKFAAKALDRFGARRRIALVAADNGHGVGDTREQLAREAATLMAFALSVTGHPDFQPAVEAAR